MKKVLIVEDDPGINRALCIRIQAAGYEVHCATDAFTGLSKVMEIEPELVIVDISMPIVDGFGFVEQMKQSSGSKATPFIILTASKRPEYQEKALAMGAYAFMEKPYESMQLIDSIDAALADLANWS